MVFLWVGEQGGNGVRCVDFDEHSALSIALRGVLFNNDVELRVWLEEFFESRPGDFYRRGIEKLVERWEQVVTNNGDYIID